MKTDYIWPVRLFINEYDVAQALVRHSANVCVVGDGSGGFAFNLTATGAWLGADLAAAYLLIGQMPPRELLLDCLRQCQDEKLLALFTRCAEELARHDRRPADDLAITARETRTTLGG